MKMQMKNNLPGSAKVILHNIKARRIGGFLHGTAHFLQGIHKRFALAGGKVEQGGVMRFGQH